MIGALVASLSRTGCDLKVCAVCAFVLVSVVATLVSEVFWHIIPISHASLSFFVYNSSHVLSAIAFAYMQDMTSEWEWNLDHPKTKDLEGQDLNVDAASEDEDIGIRTEEEEEEEEANQ